MDTDDPDRPRLLIPPVDTSGRSAHDALVIVAQIKVGAAIAGVTFATLVALAQTAPEKSAPAGKVDFTSQIRPLLSDRCFTCHGPDSAKRKAKLRLDTRDGALKLLEDDLWVIAPGDPARSEMVRRITSGDPDEMMPPPESHRTLSEPEKALLTRWIREGAEYRNHWSLEPIAAHISAPSTGSSTGPIDAFIDARLAEESVTATPPASREALARRLALDLTGLPPTPAEIDAFVADRAPDAYARLVERYLASPAYGERMALDWLDLARYADTYGYQNDVARDMSPYRDWVIRAFNDNIPYDRFLTWQLAGDLLPNPTRDQRIATAFNRLHRQTNEGGSVEEEFRTEYVIDRVNTFGTSMLGLTMECARCHDHKFDPITQRDYYGLFAFFNSIDESGIYSHFTSATPSPSLLLWSEADEARHRQLTTRISASEADWKRLASSAAARDAFEKWRAQRGEAATIALPVPVAHLTFDTGGGPGKRTDKQFDGDEGERHPEVRTFTRTDAFSLIVRLQPTAAQDRAVIVHQSRAWTDAGSRGFELTLDRGRPFFGLIHFWPGNAVAVRAKTPLPLGTWTTVTVTYDGSSRAAGITIYADGIPLDTDVVRDRLYKDITYSKARGDLLDRAPLMIGARFRDSGFKQGRIDDLRVFDVALTRAEVETLASAGTAATPRATPPTLEQFVTRLYPPALALRTEITRLRTRENAAIAKVPEIMVMEESPEPRPAHLLKRGAYDAPGDLMTRDTPASLPPFPADQPRDRLGLARWLTARTNPLAARVAVNRIWRMHFGRGLVATQEDFGSQGRLPTHPALLDWLAAHFMDSGWDVKALHRLILSSKAYQRASHAPADLIARDPDNLLLARGPKTRLLAEEIRDGALAASGLLTRRIGGPSVKPYQPAGLWEQAGTGKKYTQDTGPALYRRSLYTFWKRTLPPPAMATFDAMSREVCTAKRDVTATPLQSLVLLNDPQFVEAARVLAEGLLRPPPNNTRLDAAARNREAFLRLIGRAPDPEEAAILARLFDEQRALFATHPDQAAKLAKVGDSPADPTIPSADLAAMTSVVSAIMNFDEFIVVR